MKEEIIKRSEKNITYERVCGYFVRVERCQSGGHGTWSVIGEAVAVVFFLISAWLIWAWLP
jgi:hypothetical protein